VKQILEISSLKNTLKDFVKSNDAMKEVIHFQNYHNYPIESFYLLWFGLSMVSNTIPDNEDKLSSIAEYRERRMKVRMWLVIFTLIFTKNIENAI